MSCRSVALPVATRRCAIAPERLFLRASRFGGPARPRGDRGADLHALAAWCWWAKPPRAGLRAQMIVRVATGPAASSGLRGEAHMIPPDPPRPARVALICLSQCAHLASQEVSRNTPPAFLPAMPSLRFAALDYDAVRQNRFVGQRAPSSRAIGHDRCTDQVSSACRMSIDPGHTVCRIKDRRRYLRSPARADDGACPRHREVAATILPVREE